MMANDLPDASLLAERAGRLVGETVRFQGMRCRVVDVVASPPTLVLRPMAGDAELQTDAYGRPWREGPRLIEISLLAQDGRSPNPELALLKALHP
jgi:hypothetical protein